MIRAIERADARSIAVLARAARFDAIPGFPDLHSAEEDVAFYLAQVDVCAGRVFDDDGHVRGFVMWQGDLIEHLYVDVGYQRKGIGSALLAAACADIAVRPIRLWTFQANDRAVAFYGKHGFEPAERTDGSGNEEHLPDVLFILS